MPRLPVSCPASRVGAVALALAALASALTACGDDEATFPGGEIDTELRLDTHRLRCTDGEWAGPVSVARLGASGEATDVWLFTWDIAAGTLNDLGAAGRDGVVYTVDGQGLACDAPGVALVAVAIAEGHYGKPALEVAEPGVLNGGGLRTLEQPPTLAVSEIDGSNAASVNAYLFIFGDAHGLDPVPLQRSSDHLWDAVWNGIVRDDLLLGALAYDAGGALVGTLGM